MKFIPVVLIFLFAIGLNAQSKKISPEKSSIHWVGKKITGQHDGTLNFQYGFLVFENSELKGGNFVVDMTSISSKDVSGSTKEKLDGHLKSEDFFGVEKHPTSELNFKKVVKKAANTYTITADLTIKGKTSPVIFDLELKQNSAEAKLSVDRTKYDITYRSGSIFDGLGDKAISDMFDLTVNLVF